MSETIGPQTDWREEGRVFYEEWIKMLDPRVVMVGNMQTTSWEELAPEIQDAWVAVAIRAHDRYWA